VLNKKTEDCRKEKAEIIKAYNLFKPHVPPGATLTIEETDSKLCSRYYIRMEYTSKKSGRKISILAKGDHLPPTTNSLRFYLAQIQLTPTEVAKEFSSIYYRERVARQNAFLFSGGKSRGNSVQVASAVQQIDKLVFEEYN